MSRRACVPFLTAFLTAGDYKEAWPAEDARTLGAAVEFRRMAWIEAGPFICPANEVAWHPVHPEYDLGEHLFREIADRVRREV